MKVEKDEKEETQTPERTIRETYENRGVGNSGAFKCFKVSARELVENYFGERFSFDFYNDTRTSENGRVLVWRGEYLEGIKLKIIQKDGILERVGVKYNGNDPEVDLREIREVLLEAGLEKRVL